MPPRGTNGTRPPTPFTIGQLVRIPASGRRAVVVDVDFTYQPAADWPDELAAELAEAADERPWLRLLLDGGGESYVRDDVIEADPAPRPIEHPDLEHAFDVFVDGHYARSRGLS